VFIYGRRHVFTIRFAHLFTINHAKKCIPTIGSGSIFRIVFICDLDDKWMTSNDRTCGNLTRTRERGKPITTVFIVTGRHGSDTLVRRASPIIYPLMDTFRTRLTGGPADTLGAQEINEQTRCTRHVWDVRKTDAGRRLTQQPNRID